MLSIAKRTTVGAALLLVMPVSVWISGWNWQPGHSVWWLKSLYWVTETVTQPWGIITHVLLCAWFLWCLRFRLKAAMMLLLFWPVLSCWDRGKIAGEGAGAGTPTLCYLAGKNAPYSR